MSETAELKRCCRCNELKPITSFYRDRHSKSGRSGHCAACSKEQSRKYRGTNPEKRRLDHIRYRENNRERVNKQQAEWRKKNPAKVRKYYVKCAYGILPEEYDRMLSQQDGKCALCGQRPENRLIVDHDHETGAVRGLVCYKCNTGLGCFGDDISQLERAIEFIKEHKEALCAV